MTTSKTLAVDLGSILTFKDVLDQLRSNLSEHPIVVFRSGGTYFPATPELLVDEEFLDGKYKDDLNKARTRYEEVNGLGDTYFNPEKDVFAVFLDGAGPVDPADKRGRRMKAAFLHERKRGVAILDAETDIDLLKARLKF